LTRPRATAGTASALAVAVSTAVAAGAGAAREPASHGEWVQLVRRYARGDRAGAVAGLAAWSETALGRQVAAVEDAAHATERCPRCPSLLDGLPLRAAVMLHWERDRADRPTPAPREVEQARRCPGVTAVLAVRLARVMARDAGGSDFARRFFRVVVRSCQWDACFADAERWAGDAIQLFPADAELLLDRGSVREEVATIGWPWTARASDGADAAAVDDMARRERLEQARQDLAAAVAIDPRLSLARLRLARVLWRLGEPEPARGHLEAALSSPGPVELLYLAHLFLGRVHQDAGRLQPAASEYRLARELRPTAPSARTALSSVLLAAGDAGGAKGVLRSGLEGAGRRPERDPFWDYLVLNAAGLDELEGALRRDSLE
jgi:tetratricopeptide (TPR) repeat protein